MNIMKQFNTLPIRELIKLITDFVEPDWKSYTKKEKLKWISNYRNVEKENIEAIERHGSVESWYLSGEGRLLEFETNK